LFRQVRNRRLSRRSTKAEVRARPCSKRRLLDRVEKLVEVTVEAIKGVRLPVAYGTEPLVDSIKVRTRLVINPRYRICRISNVSNLRVKLFRDPP